MKIIAQTLAMLSAIVILILGACSEPTTIGTDLLEQDQSDIRFVDTFTLRAMTIKEDSVRIFDPNPQAQFFNYLCGNYTDPVFGQASSDLYIQLSDGVSTPPDYSNVIVDSLVLQLTYDSAGMYGNFNDIQTLEVFRIEEFISNDMAYFSNQSFAVGNTLLGSKSFRPRFDNSDSLLVQVYSNGDTITLKQDPHVRIQLTDPELIDLLTSLDTMDYVDDNFIQAFNGLFITATNPSQAMMSFDLANQVSGMTLYYRTIDNVVAQYKYDIISSTVKHSNYQHDFSGTVVDDAFNDQVLGDSILYIQGMSGPNIEVDIPYLSVLRDQAIINKAELVFTIASDVDDPIYSPIDQIILTQRNADGILVVISDVFLSLNRDDIGLFGGQIQETIAANGEMVHTYTLNISSHFQEMIEGTVDTSLVLRVFPKQERGSRTVLFGPNHSQYPAKLNLTYTQLNQ